MVRADTKADTVEQIDDPVDLAHALKTAPRGLDISDPTFQLGEFKGNAANVFRRGKDDNDSTGILQVTNKTKQLGAIWSNIDDKNYIDISQDQTMSMWLYFGKPIDKSRPRNVGDGMAFVLQNDIRGKNAISTFDGKPAPGETLGVWGADFDNSNRETKEEDIAKTSIQNSYAIEFDTFADILNKYGDVMSGEGVAFDLGIPIDPYDNKRFQHIGMNYPNYSSTYKRHLVNEMDESLHYFTKNYIGENVEINNGSKLNEMYLTDAQWHHMTVKFEHNTHTLSFDYDDKDLDGTYKTPKKSASKALCMKNFNLGDRKKLRWGFTGSTGKFMENNLIVFESIPSFVSADTSASIKNVTKNYTIADGDHVDIGDDLDFTYNLNYESGSKEWSKILASMNLPSNVTFHSGSVIYNDDAGNVEKILLSEYANNNVRHTLLQNLSDSNKKATIVLHTTVNSVDTQTPVGEAVAKFSSDNFIINDKTPNFIIDVNELNISAKSSELVNYDSLDKVPDAISINGEVWYSKIPTTNPSTVKIKSSLDGSTLEDTTATVSNTSKAPFVFSIDKSKLHIGKNTLTIYGQDSNNNKRTKEVTIIFNIGGIVSFGTVSDTVAFKDVTLGYKGEIVPRKPGWQVEVIDGRSNQKGWTLQAMATPLVNSKTNNQLVGDIVYRDDNGKISSLLALTDIYSHAKSTNEIETFDVANAWTKNNGMLLRLNGKNKAGLYSGKIDWHLVDSIKNENTKKNFS
ncbi:lectin-like domain-containing protein [Companilactobacillus muriivasis]|uniref:lectin-like domain-containing protein n=1 Tax=Companilactobacillus muriivasis TaxID=3081444 RepID=UPI0030C6F3C9